MDRYLIVLNGVYYLRFRIPKRYGGGLIKVSLQTRDPGIAHDIRDRYILPLLTYKNVTEVLFEIAKQISAMDKAALKVFESLPVLIAGKSTETTLSEAVERYIEWLNKSGKRPASVKNYRSALSRMFEALNDEKISTLTREDAKRARDYFIENEIGATRIDFIFASFRQFLRWTQQEGYSVGDVDKRFTIDLPAPDKQHTAMIPPESANTAMNIYFRYTLAPRIARYSGMRVGEIERIARGDGENKMIIKHGIQCFQIDEMSKTKKPRLVPVAECLKPYLKDLAEVVQSTKGTTRYNVLIKTVPGCEKCSFHSWRVYANTTMMEAGIDRAVRMAILGHSTGDDIHAGYTAARLETLKKAVDLIP